MTPGIDRNAGEIHDRLSRAEQLYRDEMERLGVPTHLRDGLVRYLVHRIRPGSFLCAVIADDAVDVRARADYTIGVADLASLSLFLMRVAPANAWGSYEVLERWLDHGRSDAALAETSMHGGEQ